MREASMVGTCALIFLSGATVAYAEYLDAQDEPNWLTTTSIPAVKDCAVKTAMLKDGTTLILELSFNAPPFGEKVTLRSDGPLKSERIITSTQAGIFGGGLREVQYGAETGDREFTFSIKGAEPDTTYDVVLRHDQEMGMGIGPLNSGSGASSSFSPCGSIALNKATIG